MVCRRLVSVFVSVICLAAVCPAALLTHYALDETAGTVAADSAGTNNGTVSDQTWGIAGANVNTGTAVRVGTAGELLGHGPGVLSAYTYMFWINASYGGYNRVTGIGSQANHLSFSHENGGWELVWNSADPFAGGSGLRTGWQHIAMAGSGGSMTVYLDGGSVWTGAVAAPDFSEFRVTTSPGHAETLAASIDDVALWDEVLDSAAITELMTNGLAPPGTATKPSPSNGATYVALEADLSWTVADGTVSQDVYFGTDATAVENAAAGSGEYQTTVGADVNSLDPGPLAIGTTYYWRIDEVNEADVESPYVGRVWGFTTDDGKARNPTPANGQRNLPADVTLSWTGGLLATSHDVFFGTDPAAVAAATRLAGDIDGDGPVNWLDVAALAAAWLETSANPKPPADRSGDGTVNFVDYSLAAGDWLEQGDAIFLGNVAADSFSLTGLGLESEYYWRIDAVDGGRTFGGDVWSFDTNTSFGPEHVIVYHESGKFAGWPSNGGLWYWGDDEIVVGFEQADFECKEGHNNSGDQFNVLARSTDGGFTWTMYNPPNYVGDGGSIIPSPGNINFGHPDFAMRVTDDRLYISYDRCASWEGVYWMGPFGEGTADNWEKTSRTDYIVNGPGDCHVFMSARSGDFGTDRAFCVRTTDGGATFQFQGWMVPPSDPYRAVMPSTIRVSPTKLVSAIRRRNMDSGCDAWVDVYVSNDNGVTWSFASRVGDTGCENGNPPALVRLDDGRLCCAYGNRTDLKMYYKYSENEGQSWGPRITMRDDLVDCADDAQDLGYPRIMQLYNGRIICAYYFSSAERIENHIAATIWKD
jgi:hypothetical protein